MTLAEGTNGGSVRSLGWQATHREKRLTTADGTGIAYEVLGRGDHTIVLANGLGGRLYAWEPAIEAFWSGSSAPREVKLTIGGTLFVLVLAYVLFAGRGSDEPPLTTGEPS